MATAKEQATVARTFRAAIRIGEDFYTVEETITLPIDASDEQIAQAVNAGMRIYEAQRNAAETQVREMRSQVAASPLPITIREPDAPASDKQRSYMDYLVNELGWSNDRLHEYATEYQYNLITLNKREASELIDKLKGLMEARGDADETSDTAQVAQPVEPTHSTAPARPASIPSGDLATARQVKALERLAEERGFDATGELAARYDGRTLAQLSMDEAGELLSEWQQRPRNGRPVRRAA